MRRRVFRSPAFLDKAQSLFPHGGSADGRASFELFERLILKAAEEQLARAFDDLPVAVAELPSIRYVMTHAVPFFPALVIYAMVVADPHSGEYVELVGLDVDDDYWDLATDPGQG